MNSALDCPVPGRRQHCSGCGYPVDNGDSMCPECQRILDRAYRAGYKIASSDDIAEKMLARDAIYTTCPRCREASMSVQPIPDTMSSPRVIYQGICGGCGHIGQVRSSPGRVIKPIRGREYIRRVRRPLTKDDLQPVGEALFYVLMLIVLYFAMIVLGAR